MHELLGDENASNTAATWGQAETQVRKTPEKQFLLGKPRFVAHGWYMIPIAPEELKSEGNMAAANNAAEEKLAENAKSAVDERMVAA